MREAALRQHEVSDRARARMIEGEVVPAEDMAARIARATDGAIRFDDWTVAPEGAWNDRPAVRPPLRRAA
jgi:hypothetical protein